MIQAIKTIISSMYFGDANKVEYNEFVFANNLENFFTLSYQVYCLL